MKDVFSRMLSATGCRSRRDLAVFLRVAESGISDAERRGSFPRDWLQALETKGIDAGWVLTGKGEAPKPVHHNGHNGQNGPAGECGREGCVDCAICEARALVERLQKILEQCPCLRRKEQG